MRIFRLFRWVVAFTAVATTAWAQQTLGPTYIPPSALPVTQAARPDVAVPNAEVKPALDDALRTAQKTGRRVLVIYAGSWCVQCPALQAMMESAPEVMLLVRDGYVAVRLNVNDLVILQDFAQKLDPELKLTRDNGPLLTILDKNGSLLDARADSRLLENGAISSAKLAKYLTRWTLEAPASEVYQKGLAQLRPQAKLGFVEFGADWCVWCHRMDKFFDQSPAAAILHDHYIRIAVDYERNEGAPELAKRLGAPAGDGLPLWAVVDADGKPLANSNSVKGNIGFPGTPEEIAEFVTMLQSTAKGITPAQAQVIKKALQDQKPQH